jgi:hypothetical protein
VGGQLDSEEGFHLMKKRKGAQDRANHTKAQSHERAEVQDGWDSGWI